MPRQIAPAASRQIPGVYHSLRIGWRSGRAFATHARLYCVEVSDDPGIITDAVRLCRRRHVQLGYRVFTSRLPSFSQLTTGPGVAAFASVPLLVVSGPFLIMRNTILGRRLEGRRFEFVFLSTLIAGFWSLMSGLVLVMTLQACGFLLA